MSRLGEQKVMREVTIGRVRLALILINGVAYEVVELRKKIGTLQRDRLCSTKRLEMAQRVFDEAQRHLSTKLAEKALGL